MNLIIMRHGIAEPSYADDYSRQLTPEGIEGVQRNLEILKGYKLSAIDLFSSPLTRAKQTASLVSNLLNCGGATQYIKELEPESGVSDLLETLGVEQERQADATTNMMLVSHQPLVSLLVNHLTGEDIYLDTADIFCIKLSSFEKRDAELTWRITSES